MSRHYTRTLTLPATKQDSLANFIQMIINRLETALEDDGTGRQQSIEGMREQVRDTLLIAVDLWENVHSGNYREVAGSVMTAAQKEVQDQHVAELASAHEAGRQSMKTELAAGILGKLGLA